MNQSVEISHPPRRLGTIEQYAAEHLISISTVRRLIARGEIKTVRPSPGRVFVEMAATA
jgi:hypothetical protein